ncbi:Hypothetical protein CGLY_16680 (plasmid) [Corynebacterium glyciniphilum AJ 3170]|uniref:Uncharacterized protein n=1 Tax=Corynebacterium glyciniphilum AJ 3170 TaxID=1404245 RepID=X5DWM9_9CORY|nr:hypothetical protein [Corynebacterium glyciniphilum]AHW65709.1 Hypothetical protein CGLY_16680 [Corynebacterium glyciniphilum AJ 3170]
MSSPDDLAADADAGAAVEPEVARPLPFGLRKCYAIPGSLDELRGPVDGMIQIPQSIHWARKGGSTVDLSTPGGRSIAYGAALGEGTLEQVCAIVNRDHLVGDWATIPKSIRMTALWESRFDELERTLTDQQCAYYASFPNES